MMELHGGERSPRELGGCADGEKTPSPTGGVPVSRTHSAASHRPRKPFRSTKGASKARRALLGAELRALRDLLPVARGERARLSHLHVMALTCVRARAARTLGTGVAEGGHWDPILADPASALPGFLLLLTVHGKIVHVADCVSEHLGHSVVELLSQGDSIYDVVESSDHEEVRLSLQGPTAQSAEVSFVCRMNTARSMRRPGLGASRPILVRGRYLRRHGGGG
ncbi:neuronal PAS domain-containing protein 4-like, partial [Lethenteron reissneri]|uniref:neuronal PAS domain-containing protein 4-like n=1 Tax=Lethenteron reissneri TaxID=7753 RepID=UPI002AB65A15